jgi:hypothetical protein
LHFTQPASGALADFRVPIVDVGKTPHDLPRQSAIGN